MNADHLGGGAIGPIMIRYDRKARILAITLSALAGYVDAIGFIISGGFFASFMSGNSTRLSVGLIDADIDATPAAFLLPAFVCGVAGGSIIGHWANNHRRPVLLCLIAVALALAATVGGLRPGLLTVVLLAFAMGSENAIFEKNGETRVGLTYMTGTLVKVGHGLANLALGRNQGPWLPYLFLWMGLIAGAITGAFAYSHLHAAAIWLASGWAILLAGLSLRLKEEDPLS